MPASQAGRRGFESRLPLKTLGFSESNLYLKLLACRIWSVVPPNLGGTIFFGEELTLNYDWLLSIGTIMTFGATAESPTLVGARLSVCVNYWPSYC